MKQIPKTREDIKKLLYEQVSLLTNRLSACPSEHIPGIIQAIIAILNVPF